jgi:hypothetical protein
VADTVASLRAKGGEYAASVTPEMIERIANAMPDMRPGKEGLDVLGRPYGTDLTATSLIAAGEAVDTLADIGIVAAGTATGLTPLAVGAVGATSLMEAGGAAADEVSQMIDQAAQLGEIKNADGSAVNAEQLAEIKRIAQGQAYAGAGGVAAFSDPLVAATLGTGKITQGILKSPFMVQQLAKMGITAGSEFGSGYGEQVATNIAGQGAGVDVGTTEGATGSGLLEATGGVGAGTVSTGVDTAGKLLSRGPDQVIAEQRAAAPVLDPSKFPTSGQPAQSTVQSSYDEAGISGASDTMRSEIAPDKLTVAEELMMNQLEDEGAIDLNQLRDLDLTLFEMQSVADSAITKKMDADANMLQFVAEQEAIDNNGVISAELVDEIQTKLSPELAAEVIETASNAPYVDASGQSRMDIFLNNQTPSSLPAAPTEGIAPKVDTTSVGEASIAKAPASGIETVVAKSPDDIIAEQRQKSLIADLAISGNLTNESAEQLASQLGVDVITALDLVEEAAESMTSGEIDAAAVAAAEKAGSEVYDNFKPTTTLGKTTGILSAKDEAAREAAFNKAYEDALAASRKDLFVGTGSDNADNAATEVKLPVAEETAAVVTEKAGGGADVELSEGSTSKTVVEKDGDSKTTRKTGAAVTETDTGATVELTPEQEVQAVEELYQKADSEIDNATDVKAVEELYQKADSEIDALTGIDTEAATDTSTDSTTDIKVLTEVGEFPEPEVEVEVEDEDEVQEPGGDVTVDVDEDDTFVPVITSTDENGETITECPEGYVMVEGPDGPMCQKSVTSSRQRAGASTRAYTGLAGNIGRTGPGQRRRSTTTTERVRPTVRSA